MVRDGIDQQGGSLTCATWQGTEAGRISSSGSSDGKRDGAQESSVRGKEVDLGVNALAKGVCERQMLL